MNKVHGEFIVTLSGNVMLIQAFGPWNTECAEQFSKGYALALKALKDKHWADLIVLRGESLLIPDAERTLLEKIRWARSEGLERVAIVTGKSNVGVTSRMQLENLYGHFEFAYGFFDDYEQGLAWLTRHGHHVDSDTESTFKNRLSDTSLSANL
ncbi:hypothetical protein [Alteromonas sp. 14N.309.X.WAT.G.H12]|uniref:hypothetical protein n=1 Tax=Alteromonas sp. 14N.309.X.WAT.G.H12 TaxID=3120824 RepID=UPI002FD0E084